MPKQVIKRDGRIEEFSADKFNRFADYAAQVGASMSEIALETFKRLPEVTSTNEIISTMIKVCLNKEEIAYSRTAARLEFAMMRKDMKRQGIPYDGKFEYIYKALLDKGLWCSLTMPEYDPVMDEWFAEIYDEQLEFWQAKQFSDKYAVRNEQGMIAETPHIAALGIGLAFFGLDENALELAKAIIKGQINLPTPALNGCRNGDWDTISCCVITGGDTVDSIGVAEHIAYKMTAKKAGIGIEFQTRSINDSVKNGRVKHLGKVPIYATVDKAVKMFTQVTRGGSATVTYRACDPEIEELILLKSQRTPENKRLDKLDYSFAYNDAFAHAVIKNEDWHLFSLADCPGVHASFHMPADIYNEVVADALKNGHPHKTIKARELLKTFLMTRQETGRIYCINLTRANMHTPFEDVINLSNLCQEICLPTTPYVDMNDLYGPTSVGETAFCALAAINVAKVPKSEYESIAEIAVRTVDSMLDRASMMTQSMQKDILDRRSIGIGITGLAGLMYSEGLDYDGTSGSLDFVGEVAERHYYYLLKASQKLVEEGAEPVNYINEDWLPVDTAIGKSCGAFDWEALRGKPRRNSVLVAHMPTESSAVFSDATNGLYPVRKRVINKQSRKGIVQYIAPNGFYRMAWDVDNIDLAKYYSRVQDFTDQAISADYYTDFVKYDGGKVPLSVLMKHWIAQWKLGVKTMYYSNSNDENGGSFQKVEKEEDGCQGGCKL